VTPWRRISLPISSFGEANLPPVCVATGEPTDTWTTVNLLWIPRWASTLIILGPFGMLIQLMVGRKIPVRFPIHDSLVRTQHQKQILGASFSLFGAFLMAAGQALPSMAVGLDIPIIGSFTFAGLLLWFGRRPFIPVKLLSSPKMELSGARLRYVHPEFLSAVERSENNISAAERFFGKEIASEMSVFDLPQRTLVAAGGGDPWI
jgi:hypothetical protein